MADAMLDTHWQAAFPSRSRPKLYAKRTGGDSDGFRPLADANDFLVDNLQSLTQAQLFTLTENNALALRLAQEEWIKLERLAQQIKTRDPLPLTIKDPQQLPSREIFEERKEAALYGYKYEGNRKILPARFTVPEQITDQEKFDCREPPEPFAQGGLIPNEKQYRSILVAARNEGRETNPDNQKPYKENFALEELRAGTWIAKTLPPELPPPPRTRARNATLNGTSERQTRFNGEKVPMTRQLSSNTFDTSSPGRRIGTPLSGMSPALGKRKIDATDITAEIPRKKHPNQYTKAREERERLAREAALNAAGMDSPLMANADAVLPVQVSAPAPAPVKKKHPNQYTKRREREEEERRKREEEEARTRGEPPVPEPPRAVEVPPRPYWHSSISHPMVEQPYQPPPYRPQSMYPGTHPFPESMSQFQYSNYNSYGPPPNALQYPLPHRAPERPKHPNQHTKRKEREAAAAAAVALEHVMSGMPGPPPNVRMTPAGAQIIPHTSQMVTSRQSTPASQPQPTSQSTRGRDPSTMTKEELVVHPFKDHELVAFLQKDHSWLNEDPEKAETWKKRILASDYPVRTWAMFRKWREWRSDGKDKRPRDKDGKRIKQAQIATPTTGAPVQTAPLQLSLEIPRDINMTDAPPPSQQNYLNTFNAMPAYFSNNTHSMPASPAKSVRPFTRRLDTGRLGSPFPQMPGSPLVNGMNARDLNDSIPSASVIDVDPVPQGTEAQATSFKQRLSSFHEVDPATKVNTWQDKTETDYAASTYAGKGALKQHPGTQRALRSTRTSSRGHSQAVSTDDASESSSAIPNNHVEAEENSLPPQPSQNQSEETASSVIEDESEPESDSSTAPSDSNDKDGEYGSRTRARKSTRNTRTAKSSRPNIGAAMERTISTRSTRSVQNKTQPVQENSLTLTRTRSGEQAGPRSERTASPTVSRRVGLRPNLGKRTYTGESEASAGGDGTLPTRRSLRSGNMSEL